MAAFVTRFAPSPTGRLHLGHAYAALIAVAAAREENGVALLRIEDIDAGRCRPAYDEAVLQDLAWLGLRWPAEPMRQSTRTHAYEKALERLIADGLVYRCFRTRREVAEAIDRAPHGPQTAQAGFIGAPAPPSEERARIDAGEPFAWRLSTAAAQARLGPEWRALTVREASPAVRAFAPDGALAVAERPADGGVYGDAVIARKDAAVSYHLASVVDDAAQGVTCVVRGEDLAPAADFHRLLQALLGLPAPVYRHHRLILGPDGKRLAKRDRAQTLDALRAAGVGPDDVRTRLGLTAPVFAADR
ncbi:MAG: tRNA glutamyl-Q(34) synthetase GluQRS [Pseudomonadota bacterium]